MGVKGLWQLLMPVGRRISIETLEGQILAIDASIWLTQFLTVAAAKRERDLLDEHGGGNDGGGDRNRNNNQKAYSYDYLVGFLRRLCKLRYQGVRPVIVFDGATPEIKMREIRARTKRRKRKLGDGSFYLGSGAGNGQQEDDEEEEVLEATRRTAKRILAKQLREGTLITIKNKKNRKMKLNDVATTEANVSCSFVCSWILRSKCYPNRTTATEAAAGKAAAGRQKWNRK
jgi:5'-3' exonuclease